MSKTEYKSYIVWVLQLILNVVWLLGCCGEVLIEYHSLRDELMVRVTIIYICCG